MTAWTPVRDIEIFAGTPPGGGLDRTAHLLRDALRAQSLAPTNARVVNVPGDGARKVWASVDTRAGDAHVLCISSPNLTTDYLTGAAQFTHSNYTPLAILYNEYLAFVARSGSRLSSASDLLREVSDGAPLTVALSTAAGNPNHIALAQVIMHAGGDVRAPVIRVFDSALDAVADAAAGNADVAVVTAASAVPALTSGALTALAVSAPVRLGGAYAATPAWQELGVPCTLGAWRGVHGPRGLDEAQRKYWENTLSKATQGEAWRNALATQNLTAMFIAGKKLTDYLAQEQMLMTEMLKLLQMA